MGLFQAFNISASGMTASIVIQDSIPAILDKCKS